MVKEKKEEKKEKHELGLTADKDEFSEWFTQLMLKADLADYSEVSGCIVFKPASYSIWEKIKDDLKAVDQVIATEVMDWKVSSKILDQSSGETFIIYSYNEGQDFKTRISNKFLPSTDIKDTWEVVEKLKETKTRSGK